MYSCILVVNVRHRYVGVTSLQMKGVWVRYFAHVLRVAGSHSLSPLYGILDKKLLTF